METVNTSAVTPQMTSHHNRTTETKSMSETKNFFENPNSGNTGWSAGIGGAIGAALGNGGGLSVAQS